MKYELAERVLRRKQPYGAKKIVLEGYVIIDKETGIVTSELLSDKDVAMKLVYQLNRNLEGTS